MSPTATRRVLHRVREGQGELDGLVSAMVDHRLDEEEDHHSDGREDHHLDAREDHQKDEEGQRDGQVVRREWERKGRRIQMMMRRRRERI